ncbi:MAG: C-terminal binding protein [Chloroflexi bacterium]|nr:C-terminal binding protein [Chloroflexota bacterium]
MPMPYKILVTDYVWPNTEPERAVLAGIDAELIEAPDAGEDTLASMVKDVDGILTCFAQVTEKVVRAATKCVVIGRYGVGYDNIAVDVATELGIAVTYVPDYCVEEVSDHVLGLLYAWNRRIPLFDNSVKTAGWGSIALDMPILRLRGKTLGLLGYGRIGRAVGQKAHALGFRVLVYDPYISADSAELSGVRLVDMETVLKESDFISIHTPLNAETENLVGANELALMKPTAFLINCARGPLIDEDALYDALINKRIGGAGLDVLVDAHPAPDYKLLKLDNVIITPHVAFFSQEAVLELEERAAGEVVSVLQGKMPDNLVNPDVLSHPNPRHGLPPTSSS